LSEYAEILPGMWTVSCIFRAKGGCGGELHVTPDGAFVCHKHAVSVLGLKEEASSAEGAELAEEAVPTPSSGNSGNTHASLPPP
jgi:hypothetical protein